LHQNLKLLDQLQIVIKQRLLIKKKTLEIR